MKTHRTAAATVTQGLNTALTSSGTCSRIPVWARTCQWVLRVRVGGQPYFRLIRRRIVGRVRREYWICRGWSYPRRGRATEDTARHVADAAAAVREVDYAYRHQCHRAQDSCPDDHGHRHFGNRRQGPHSRLDGACDVPTCDEETLRRSNPHSKRIGARNRSRVANGVDGQGRREFRWVGSPRKRV